MLQTMLVPTRHFCSHARLLKMPKILNTVKEAGKPALQKPIPIQKPFGYDAPVSLSQTDTSLFSSFSAEARERRERQLNHDLVHSTFYESKSFNNVQGKVILPPVSYFKRDKAMFFPDFTAHTLLNKKRSLREVLQGKVSVVRVFSTVSGSTCADTYVSDYLSDEGYLRLQAKYPHVQIVDLNVPQSWVKGLFVTLSKQHLRKMVSPARHDCYFFLSNSDFNADVRKVLKCEISCAGYVYVVDETGRIRWATSGYADEKESEALWRAVAGLEKEMAEPLAKENV